MSPLKTDGFQIPELWRRLGQLLQVGVVAEVDYALARARVRAGDLLTDWLPWVTGRAGGDRDWAAPEVGEQVVLLCPEGRPERGIVLPALYRAAHPAPADRETVRRVTFADGSVVEYDREAHRLDVQVPHGGGEVRVLTEGKITVVADGDVAVAAGGVCVVEGNDSTRLGDAHAADPVARKSDLQAMVNWINGHTHTSASAGSPTSSPIGSLSTPGCSANVRSI